MVSFKDVLPSTTSRYNFEGIEQCLRVMGEEFYQYEREQSEGLSNPYVIMNVDERSFLDCVVNSGE